MPKELALYRSFDDETVEEEKCSLCGRSDDEPLNFGKKITIDGITAHHFCLVSRNHNHNNNSNNTQCA